MTLEDLEDSPEVLQVFIVAHHMRMPVTPIRCVADMTEYEMSGWSAYLQWWLKYRGNLTG